MQLTIVNNVAVNTLVRTFLWFADLDSFRCTSGNGTARSHSSFRLRFLRNIHVCFLGNWTNLYSQQQCIKIFLSQSLLVLFCVCALDNGHSD